MTLINEATDTTITPADTAPCQCPWVQCPTPASWVQVCPNGHDIVAGGGHGNARATMCHEHRSELDALIDSNPSFAAQIAAAGNVHCDVCDVQIMTPFIWRHL